MSTLQPALGPDFAPVRRDLGTLTGNHLRLLRYADARVDCTDDEVEAAGAMMLNTVRPRRGELMDSGLLEYSGASRPTRTGSPAKCWAITDKGREALEDTTR